MSCYADKKIGGFWPVMLTPFDADGRIDWPAYEQMIDFYIANGAAGLFATCGSSEVLELTGDEIVELSAKAISHSAGRVPVVSGAIADVPHADHLELFKQVADTGPYAVVLSSSQLCGEDEDEDSLFERLYDFISISGDMNLGIYEYPSPYKRVLSAAAIKKITATGKFVFFKDTSCDINIIRSKVAAVEDDSFAFFNANTATLLESLIYGVDGFSGIGGNFTPGLYSWLCENYASDSDASKRVQIFLDAVDAIGCRKYPVSAKVAMRLQGVDMHPVSRVSNEILNEEEILRIEQILLQAKELVAAIS